MAGKKGFRNGMSIKTYYKNYSHNLIWESNAEVKLERHIKKQPNDKTAKDALKRLISRVKKYTRNRVSDGHICKAHPDLVTSIANGDDRLTIIQQMENIGFKYRGRRNKKTTRQSNKRVR